MQAGTTPKKRTSLNGRAALKLMRLDGARRADQAASDARVTKASSSIAVALLLISSGASELALVTRASLAAWSARRAPSSRISLSAARPLRLVLFFGVVPACMVDILHRLRRSRPSLVAVFTIVPAGTRSASFV